MRIPSLEKPSLNFGSAMHLALEYRHVLCGNQPVTQQYNEGVTKLMSEFFLQHPPPAGDWRSVNWALEVINRYNAKYIYETFDLLKYNDSQKCQHCDGSGSMHFASVDGYPDYDSDCILCDGSGIRHLMIELPFALPLFHYTGNGHSFLVIYCGKIDLPFTENGQYWIRDHKTTSMFGQPFWDNMRMTSQLRGYCWAFEQQSGVKVTGYEINGIRTKEPPAYVVGANAKGGRKLSPEEWWNESFQRERFYIKENELSEWKNNTIELVEEFMFHYNRDYLPMKTQWCASYGRCAYYDVCQMVSSDREALLASGQFTTSDWSPLNKVKQTQK